MSWFDTLLVEPIFNILLALYAIIPGNDFGISLVLFAILVRLVMWPLVKKQLRQTKLQRQIQPELKKIKKQAKGNKQLEGQMMLELYRERGVNPFTPFAVLLIQLPIFIALFQIITTISNDRSRIVDYTYQFMSDSFSSVASVVANPQTLNENFLGIIDLTKSGYADGVIYLPLILLAAFSAFLQFYQSKQITPAPAEKKRLRDILKESAAGKEADQSEISAIMAQRMLVFFPIMAFFISAVFPGALVLFYATSSLVAVIQQDYLLREDVEDMEKIANEPSSSKNSKNGRKHVNSTSRDVHKNSAAKSSSPAASKSASTSKERSIPKPAQKRRKGSKVK